MTKTAPPKDKKRPTPKAVSEISTYSNAVRYLMDRTDYEQLRAMRLSRDMFKLDRMNALMDKLDNPQQQIRMVHVAGTVGKGSTVAMIASMLEGCGYAVGRYTSPHLIDVRERIALNDQEIPRSDFTDLMRRTSEAAAKLKEEPTFFEIITAVAFLYFAEQAVDLAVIETGLGGRFDSTNIIIPEVSVITRIAHDHAHFLGNTLPEIAREKAGIIKQGVPVITCLQDEAVEEVLREVAQEVDAPLKIVTKDIEFSCRFGAGEGRAPHSRICIVTETSQFMHLPVPLPGEHQAMNCAMALSVVDTLKNRGFDFPEVPMHEGLSKTSTPGRMEIVWERPRILVDGAHNPAALTALIRCIGAHVPYDSMVCVFGCCEDKDIPALLEKIALGGDKIIFTKAKGNPRAADPEMLQKQLREISGKMSQVAKNLPDALNLASRAVGRDDLICVTGSFYLVGEAKRHLANLARKRAEKA